MSGFESIAAAIGCVDIAARVCERLSRFVTEAKNADSEAEHLKEKVERLHVILQNIQSNRSSRLLTSSKQSDTEEDRLWEQIRSSVERCGTTLTAFEKELNCLQDKARFDSLRKALLAKRLNKISRAADIFDSNIDINIHDIQISFSCLMVHKGDKIMDKLQSLIQDGNNYLYQHPQRSKSSVAVPQDSETPSPKNDGREGPLQTAEPSGEEDDVEAYNLHNLERSIDVARSVLPHEVSKPLSQSRPSSSESRESIPANSVDRDSATRSPIDAKPPESCEGITPLMQAAQDGSLSIITQLLSSKADPHIKDQDGMNALHHAVQRFGGRDVIHALLKAGLSVDVPCESSGEAPLHIAVKQYDVHLIKQENLVSLLEEGAGLETKDRIGNTPLDTAIEVENEEVVRLLLEKGATYDKEKDPPSHVHKDIQNVIKDWQAGKLPIRNPEGESESGSESESEDRMDSLNNVLGRTRRRLRT